MRAPWIFALFLLLFPSWAQAGDETVCQVAIAGAARRLAVPHRVLGSIALVESGRPIGNRLVPWPWSINVGGVGRTFASKEEAIAAVRDLRASGIRSIDVGCMQINLAAHPQAFDSLETAFDPVSNADYAARFLQSLFQQTGQIATAITAYHSQTPQFAADYARRILVVWPGAAEMGLTAESELPTPPEPPTLYPPRLSQDLAQDHAALQRYRAHLPSTASRIEVVSSHGAAWPGTNH